MSKSANNSLQSILSTPTGWLRHGPAFFGYPFSGFALVLILSLISLALEGLGISLLYPIIEQLQNGSSPEEVAASFPVLRFVLDGMSGFGVPLNLNGLLMVAAITVILRQILVYLIAVIRAIYSQKSVAVLGVRTFEGFAHAELGYSDGLKSGTLINAVFTESKRAAMLALAAQNIIIALFKIIFFGLLLLLLSWQATLVGISMVLIVGVFVSKNSVQGSKMTGQLINEANDRLSRFTLERFSLFRLMKMQNTTRIEVNYFQSEFNKLRDLNVQVARFAARIRSLTEATVVLGGLLMIYLATNYFALGLSGLGVFLVVVVRMLPLVQELALGRQQIAAYYHSAQYIERIQHDAEAAKEHLDGKTEATWLSDGIILKDVHFTYPPTVNNKAPKPVLNGVTFKIPAGKTTALLGPSGSGKSTLIDLLPRLRHQGKGEITFDGINIEDMSQSSLRSQIAMVSQDALVVDGTIRDNLTYGCSSVDDVAMRRAADRAYASEFIDALPNGYETLVGERGILLSGGQKQRLALARALISNVPILVLDEPTSALDAESESAIQAALATLQQDGLQTMIIIAHRLASVKYADQIVVLEKGRVLGCGTHSQLMASQEWYQRVVDLQALDTSPQTSHLKDLPHEDAE